MWRILSDVVYVLMRNIDNGWGDGGYEIRIQGYLPTTDQKGFTVYLQ